MSPAAFLCFVSLSAYAADPETVPLVLLPGMDGTGLIYGGFREALGPDQPLQVIDYPTDEPLGYDELAPRVAAALPTAGPYVVLGESFSGPLALRLAADPPEGLAAVVLVASFARNPTWLPRWLAPIARAPLFSLGLPRPVLQRSLMAPDSEPAEIDAIDAAVDAVRPAVMARRAREILRVDARDAAAGAQVPLGYLGAGADRLVKPRSRELLSELAPGAPTRIVEGAPHLALQCRPEGAVAALRALLSELLAE